MNVIKEILNGKTISTNTKEDFLSAVKEIERTTEYVDTKISDLQFDEFTETEYALDSGLRISCPDSPGNGYNCLPYAVKTACDKVGISGPVLSRFSNKKLAEILNKCREEYKEGENVMLVTLPNEDRSYCISVLSDDYKILPAEEVFEESVKEIEKLGGSYAGGFVNTDIFYSLFEINNKELENTYKDKFEDLRNAVPMISVETSNTGLSSVAITPKFKIGSIEMIIGKPLKTLHKGESDMMAVRENINQIFPIFKEAIDGLSRLKNIKIENPLFCFKNIAKKVLLPKKYAMMAAEDFCNFIDDGEINAYELYFALCETIFYAKNDNRPKTFLNNLQEQVARALYLDFSKYDTPYSDWK